MSDPASWPPPPPPQSTARPPSGVAFEAPGADDGQAVTIGAVPATLGTAVVWIVSTVVSGLVLVGWVALTDGDIESITVWGTVVALLGQWAAVLVGLWLISRMFGTGNLVVDYGIKFRPFRNGRIRLDFFGFFAGVATQLILVPLVYIPLQALWPDTFSNENLEERARLLVSDATGASLVVLAICISLGAPLVEEMMYRGLLQRSLQAPLHRVGAWVLVSAVFAAVHFAPVEFPGLFVGGLVFGLGVLVTNRIGWGLSAHFGFNACAMVILLATR